MADASLAHPSASTADPWLCSPCENPAANSAGSGHSEAHTTANTRTVASLPRRPRPRRLRRRARTTTRDRRETRCNLCVGGLPTSSAARCGACSPPIDDAGRLPFRTRCLRCLEDKFSVRRSPRPCHSPAFAKHNFEPSRHVDAVDTKRCQGRQAGSAGLVMERQRRSRASNRGHRRPPEPNPDFGRDAPVMAAGCAIPAFRGTAKRPVCRLKPRADAVLRPARARPSILLASFLPFLGDSACLDTASDRSSTGLEKPQCAVGTRSPDQRSFDQRYDACPPAHLVAEHHADALQDTGKGRRDSASPSALRMAGRLHLVRRRSMTSLTSPTTSTAPTLCQSDRRASAVHARCEQHRPDGEYGCWPPLAWQVVRISQLST
jgi:hypothetical protein